VILSACFNYTNLSIARSLRRAHEVGIRKVIGARWSQVVIQFVVEAVVIALCALVFSFLLFLLIKPYFISLNDLYADMLVLDLSPRLIAYFCLMAVGVGMLAGIFPALFFARTNATQVLKNISAIRLFRNVTVRKALIVLQFTVSLIFISGTIIGVKQYREILAFDLGFNTENVLNIKLFGNDPNIFKKALLEMPEVTAVSKSSLVTSIGNYWGTSMKYNDPHDSASVYFVRVDENYIPLHGHKLAAGRNFLPKSDDAEESELIVNEKVLNRFNITNGNPTDAVGEIVTINGKKVQIIGVVKDYSYGRSTDLETKGVILRYSANQAEYINAKILSTDWPATRAKIETAWKAIDPVHPLDAKFYDDEIENAYVDFSARIKVVGALAFLAICIASIGLLGMVVFTTETRLKEISIRKVLGANEANLVYLLSKGFLILLGISALIAIPATQYIFINYVLDEYAVLAPAAWRELVIGMCGVIGVAFLMIGSHTLHAARRNPAEILKSE
jgi:ABC-type antimicrobial peptide transport system permease subunit